MPVHMVLKTEPSPQFSIHNFKSFVSFSNFTCMFCLCMPDAHRKSDDFGSSGTTARESCETL